MYFNRPKIMFYFRTTPFYTADAKDLTQYRKVLGFRKKLRDLGVVFFEYTSCIDFERKVREHLIRKISQIALTGSSTETQEGQLQTRVKEKLAEVTTLPVIQGVTVVGETSKIKPDETRKPSLFFSYVREDSEKVKEIYNVLRSVGFNPWLDVENLYPGQDWYSEIASAISRADFFLIFLSNNSISKRGYIQKEIRVAVEKAEERPPSDIFIIPIRLDEAPIPELLQHLQWVDIFREGGTELLIKSITAAWENKNGKHR
jgi:hypothetical protein